jgi:Trk-type K+ transport system membrane component
MLHSSLATVSNIGPGLAGVGPTENFAFFAAWQKLVIVILMWLGRLEFFAVVRSHFRDSGGSESHRESSI